MKASRIFALGIIVAVPLSEARVSVAAAPEKFSRHEIRLKESPGRKPTRKPTIAKLQTGWRIDLEEPITEDRPLMEDNPLTKRRCIFYRDRKLYCWHEAFMGIFPSADDKSAIAYGWGEPLGNASINQLVIAVDSDGRVINKWESTASGFPVGKASQSGDLFVSLWEAQGSVHLAAFDLKGSEKWRREFKGAQFRDITPDALQVSAAGTSVIASFGRTTRVFDQKGNDHATFKDARYSRLSPDQRWALICGNQRAIIYEFQTKSVVVETSELPAEGSYFSCPDISPASDKALVLERNVKGPRKGGIDRVHILDLKAKRISTAKTKLPAASLWFDDGSRIRIEHDEKIEVFELNE